jgi:hypothetical protein
VDEKVMIIVGSVHKVEFVVGDRTTVNVVVYVLAIEVEERDVEGSELVDTVVMAAMFAGAETPCFLLYAHQSISATVCI